MQFVPPWAGAFRLQTYVNSFPEAVAVEDVETIRQTILGSPFLASTQLEGGFTGTLGFSITFRRENIGMVEETFPAFIKFLDAAMLPGCDAFILNPLVVLDGGGVTAHVDGSLRGFSPTIGCPQAVSVLYVQVPENLEGGQLRLFRRGREVARVTPTPRTLLHFRGDLLHEVAPIRVAEPTLERARVSLVVEQYRLTPADHLRVPEFRFHSTALARYMQ